MDETSKTFGASSTMRCQSHHFPSINASPGLECDEQNTPFEPACVVQEIVDRFGNATVMGLVRDGLYGALITDFSKPFCGGIYEVSGWLDN